jgi:hypothetical protein
MRSTPTAGFPVGCGTDTGVLVDVIVGFLLEVVFFSVGKWLSWIVTLGRVSPRLSDKSQPLVTLLGALVTIATAAFILIWLI